MREKRSEPCVTSGHSAIVRDPERRQCLASVFPPRAQRIRNASRSRTWSSKRAMLQGRKRRTAYGSIAKGITNGGDHSQFWFPFWHQTSPFPQCPAVRKLEHQSDATGRRLLTSIYEYIGSTRAFARSSVSLTSEVARSRRRLTAAAPRRVQAIARRAVADSSTVW